MGSLENPKELTPCVTLDQVIRQRAETHTNEVLLSSPRDGTGDYVEYTGRDLERLTRLVGKTYADQFQRLGLFKDTDLGKSPDNVIAMVGISSLDYYITFLALQRLGVTSMFLSPRLADQGYAHLIGSTGCKVVVASGNSIEKLGRVSQSAGLDLTVIPLVDTASLEHEKAAAQLEPVNDGESQGFIIHSGGTTGLPKAVRLQSQAWLLQAANIGGRMPKVDTLSTLPLFHSFGLATLLRCLVNGKRLSIIDASRPITAAAILSGLDSTSSEALVTVPYIMGFFTEIPGGVQRLASLRQVIAAGSAIPDALGDELAAAGTNLFHLYGQTESGALMEPSQDQWNWVTPLPATEPYLKFEPMTQGDENTLYHLILLPGLKAKVMSDRPDGSYGTKDLFQRHPTDPRKWKFAARQDDMIVLVNGEKADPTPLEAAVSRNANVRAAVVFGARRDALGMIVIPAERAAALGKDEILASVLPDLELGNSRVPTYARISPESVVIKDVGTEYPITDKATVIRSRFLQQFTDDIDAFYETREQTQSASMDVVADADIPGIVYELVRHELGPKGAGLSETSDFFSLGMDSLQATNVRAGILKKISLPAGKHLMTNVVFDHPSVQILSSHLFSLRGASESDTRPLEDIALDMVKRYSNFVPGEPGALEVDGENILLTGATGAVGGHIVFSLLKRDDVHNVYCLVRATDRDTALERVKDALVRARLSNDISPAQMSKIIALPCNLSDSHFGLSDSSYHLLQQSVTAIIHNAWSVNFNMGLQSFEVPCISSTFQLLNLAASSSLRRKPTFIFISSVASVLNVETNGKPISESRYGWDGVAMGYGQSKWVAEEICAAAAGKAGLTTRVLRLGQITGDTKHGIWNPAEAIPTTVQAALTMKALPLVGPADWELSWLPVDVAAAAIVELGLLEPVSLPLFSVSHVANEKTLKWNAEFLPGLKGHGLKFEAVPQREWVQRLEGSNPDVSINPAYKLLEFFRHRYGTISTKPEPLMDTTESKKLAPSLGNGTSVGAELIGKFLRFWREEAWPSIRT